MDAIFATLLFSSCLRAALQVVPRKPSRVKMFYRNLRITYTQEHSFRLFAHFYKSVVKYLQVNEAITLKEPFRKHFG